MTKYLLTCLVALVALPSFAGITRNVDVYRLEIDGVAYGSSWKFDSPAVHTGKGYLSYDATGKSTAVTVNGPKISWEFADRKSYEHKESGRAEDREYTGYSMKLRATEGPLAGWYLGNEDGSWVLVKSEKEAARLTIIQHELVRAYR